LHTFVPDTELQHMIAIEDVPGGYDGVAEVGGRLMAVVSEQDDERNYDANASDDNDILVWINLSEPGGPLNWKVPARALTMDALGVSWLAETPDRADLIYADEEKLIGQSCNVRDTDIVDNFPTIGFFDSTQNFDWRGYCYAAESFNPGVVLIDDTVFFRASEAEQNFDINEDGDANDMVLLRHGVFPLGTLLFVDTLNNLPGDAVFTGTDDLVAFYVDEAMAGEDRNRDGDKLDLVLRYTYAGQ